MSLLMVLWYKNNSYLFKKYYKRDFFVIFAVYHFLYYSDQFKFMHQIEYCLFSSWLTQGKPTGKETLQYKYTDVYYVFIINQYPLMFKEHHPRMG